MPSGFRRRSFPGDPGDDPVQFVHFVLDLLHQFELGAGADEVVVLAVGLEIHVAVDVVGEESGSAFLLKIY